jgi:hypothetical protein
MSRPEKVLFAVGARRWKTCAKNPGATTAVANPPGKVLVSFFFERAEDRGFKAFKGTSEDF